MVSIKMMFVQYPAGEDLQALGESSAGKVDPGTIGGEGRQVVQTPK